jgi:hypothetical protein
LSVRTARVGYYDPYRDRELVPFPANRYDVGAIALNLFEKLAQHVQVLREIILARPTFRPNPCRDRFPVDNLAICLDQE